MNLESDFVQVSKLSEDQKKKTKMEHFFSPNSGKGQKKDFTNNRTPFFSKFKWTPTQVENVDLKQGGIRKLESYSQRSPSDSFSSCRTASQQTYEARCCKS